MKQIEKILEDDTLVFGIFAFGVITAEIISNCWQIFIGLILYLYILLALLIISYLKNRELGYPLYLALTLIPMIRIISVSIPLEGISEIWGFVVVSIPVFTTGFMVAKMVGLTHFPLRLSFNRSCNKAWVIILGLQLGFAFPIMSTANLTPVDVSTVFKIDLIVILTLIGLLIFKEFLRSYFEQHYLFRQENKHIIGRIIDLAIVPFLYVFCYVIVYRILHI